MSPKETVPLKGDDVTNRLLKGVMWLVAPESKIKTGHRARLCLDTAAKCEYKFKSSFPLSLSGAGTTCLSRCVDNVTGTVSDESSRIAPNGSTEAMGLW